jgi:hypothetical protein
MMGWMAGLLAIRHRKQSPATTLHAARYPPRMPLARAASAPLVQKRAPLEKFPTDVPFPEGTYVDFESEETMPETGPAILLSAQSEESAEALAEFYVRTLREDGWEVQIDPGTPDEPHLLVKRGGRGLDITIQSDRTFSIWAFDRANAV